VWQSPPGADEVYGVGPRLEDQEQHLRVGRGGIGRPVGAGLDRGEDASGLVSLNRLEVHVVLGLLGAAEGRSNAPIA